MNVQQALALVEDVVNLKGCANGVVAALREDDLVGATGYVRQFHDIASIAAQASDDYERMVATEKMLKSRVLDQFILATEGGAAAPKASGGGEGGEGDPAGGAGGEGRERASSSSGRREEVLSDEVAKYCALLGPLGLADEGLQGYLKFARRAMKQVIDGDGGDNGQDDGADGGTAELSRLFNAAAAFLQQHLAVASAALSGADGGAALLQLVHHDVQEKAMKIIKRFILIKDLTNRTSIIASMGPGHSGDMNDEIDDIGLVMQHSETYDRYLRHLASELERETGRAQPVFPSVTPLNETVAELGGYYTLLEQAQLESFLRKAIEMDEVQLGKLDAHARPGESSAGGLPMSPGGVGDGGDGAGGRGVVGGISSSSVEDALYVAQCAAQRAIAAGHPGSCSAVINHVNNALGEELLDHLTARAAAAAKELGKVVAGGLAGDAQKLMRTGIDLIKEKAGDRLMDGVKTMAGQSGGGGAAGSGGAVGEESVDEERRTVRMALVALNNLESASVNIVRLRDELLAEVREAFPSNGPAMAQLIACVSELQATAQRFSTALEDVLSTVGKQLQPRLRTTVADLLSIDKHSSIYLLDEAGYQATQSSSFMPWSVRLTSFLDELLLPYSPGPHGLCESNSRTLLCAVASYVGKRLLVMLRQQRFSQLGGMQLDKDVRTVIAWFTARCGREVRDTFGRLSQFALLLNLDRPADVLDFWGVKVNGMVWQLTADELRKVTPFPLFPPSFCHFSYQRWVLTCSLARTSR